MGGFAMFKHIPALEMMLTFAGWQRGFSKHDKEAMADGLNVIRTALVQPVGLSREKTKREGFETVTEAEFDRAVMNVLAAAMVLWLSGKLDELEVDG